MILVTGATGFLGHHLIPQLCAAGYAVRALVRPSSDTRFLQELGVELAYTDDISNPAAARAACDGCEQVIHAAGQFRFWGNAAAFARTNVGGTQALLAAATAVGVQRFIHISTIVVIGQTAKQGELDETTPCHPLEPYQRTKYEAEQLALAYHHEQGLPVVVLRPGAFYGPYGRYAFNRLFFEEPLRGWRIKVDGGRRITFPVYVPDVAQAIMLALTNGRVGEIYHICSQSLDHNSVNSVVSDLAGIGRWRINVPKPVVLALAKSWTAVSRVTHREPFYPINMAPYVFQDWRVSTAKAERELGFKPTPFRIGAQATLNWYRQNRV
jgi:nucleoside-diphosphate-sugar epimerase